MARRLVAILVLKINYLEQKGRARILSSPNLVIRRGADGNIMNGEKIPVLERTITGSSESISTRFENVGVKLIVRPIMISGKRIHVKVNPEVSSAPRTVQTGGFETPIIVVRSASTQLEANDGELITIGGLMLATTATGSRLYLQADNVYVMSGDGAKAMEVAPWQLLFPGLFFSLTIFSLNALGDGLRDALDVRGAKD